MYEFLSPESMHPLTISWTSTQFLSVLDLIIAIMTGLDWLDDGCFLSFGGVEGEVPLDSEPTLASPRLASDEDRWRYMTIWWNVLWYERDFFDTNNVLWWALAILAPNQTIRIYENEKVCTAPNSVLESFCAKYNGFPPKTLFLRVFYV